jgi:hypothetical protein
VRDGTGNISDSSSRRVHDVGRRDLRIDRIARGEQLHEVALQGVDRQPIVYPKLFGGLLQIREVVHPLLDEFRHLLRRNGD